MNRACDICGRKIALLPGAVMAGHGMFLSVTIGAGRVESGFVGGVCDGCIAIAPGAAAFFERERLARGGS